MQPPSLTPRGTAVSATRVDLHRLTPPIEQYLGHCATLHLTFFEQLSHAVANAPRIADKDALAVTAGVALRRYEALVAEIERRKLDRSAIMEPHLLGVQEFERRTTGADWHEQVASAHVTIGFLTDFWMSLAAGLPKDARERVEEALRIGELEMPLHRIVQRAIAANPRLSSRLALWCRRLVGDTLLQARSALGEHLVTRTDEEHIEPVLTELISDHTRRMDKLGLTA